MKTVALRLSAAGLLLLGTWAGARAFDARPLTDGLHDAPHGSTELNPPVQVLLTGPTGRTAVALELRGEWRMRDPTQSADAPPLAEGCDFRGFLRSDPSGVSLLPYLPCRDRVLLETDGDDALRIDHEIYPGRLEVEVVRDDNSRRPLGLRLTLELPLETYVLGVVSGEMASTLQGVGEALRAQAVTARSYAVWKRSRGVKVLRDDTNHQVYRGTDYLTEAAREAVASTRGEVLTWQEELIPAFFHARCGGRTAPGTLLEPRLGDVPPLRGVADPQCRDPYDRWRRTVPPERLDRIARDQSLGDWLRRVDPLVQDAAGRMREVRLGGSEEHADLPAEKVRAAFGLPSSQWTRLHAEADGGLTVEGRAFGHGVGLCQTGAIRLARQGHDYASILGHYFPGARLRPVAAVTLP